MPFTAPKRMSVLFAQRRAIGDTSSWLKLTPKRSATARRTPRSSCQSMLPLKSKFTPDPASTQSGEPGLRPYHSTTRVERKAAGQAAAVSRECLIIGSGLSTANVRCCLVLSQRTTTCKGRVPNYPRWAQKKYEVPLLIIINTPKPTLYF